MSRLSRINTILIAASLLLFAGALPARAQEGGGTVEGVATEAGDGRPLPYSMVRLLPVPARAGESLRVLTEADGRFRIARVPAGEYRVQLERIGYQSARSEVVRVQAGQTTRVDIRGSVQAIVLAPFTAGPRCLGAGELAGDSALATLWAEAKKGVDTRRAFERQHRFRRVLRQDVTQHLRLLRDEKVVRVDTLLSEPDSVIARERAQQARHGSGRYINQSSGNFLISETDERELLREDFLTGHCLSADVARQPGLLGFTFRPVRVAEGQQTMRGTLWMDSTTFMARRLELQYSQGRQVMARVRLDFTDVPVSGGRSLRLPTSGTVTGYPRQVMMQSVSANLAYTYDQFEPVPSR
jgi:hypothetical protein